MRVQGNCLLEIERDLQQIDTTSNTVNIPAEHWSTIMNLWANLEKGTQVKLQREDKEILGEESKRINKISSVALLGV